MRDLVRRRPLLWFFVLAVAINLLANALRFLDPDLGSKVFGAMAARGLKGDMLSSINLVLDFPLAWTYLLSPAAPTIAAGIVIALMAGGTGLRSWADRLKLWRGVGWRQGVTVWLVGYAVLFAFAGVLLIVLLQTGKLDAAQRTLAVYGGAPLLIVLSLIYGVFLSVGPLLEEMGWRGFALPLLLERYSPLMASVIVGALWAAWHLPREMPILFSGDQALILNLLGKQVTFFIGTISGSIIATFLYFKLGGSVWSGIIAHALNNENSVNLLGAAAPALRWGILNIRLYDVMELLLSLVILLLAGARLGAPATVTSNPPFTQKLP